jgi:hypothetical protein
MPMKYLGCLSRNLMLGWETIASGRKKILIDACFLVYYSILSHVNVSSL